MSETQYKIEFAHTILHNRALFSPQSQPPPSAPSGPTSAPTTPSDNRKSPEKEPVKEQSKDLKLRGVNEENGKVQQYLDKIREHQQPGPIPPQKVQHAPAQAKVQAQPAHKPAQKQQPDPKVKNHEQLRGAYVGGSTPEKKSAVAGAGSGKKSSPSSGEEIKKSVAKPEGNKEIKSKAKELSEHLLSKHNEEQVHGGKLNNEMKEMKDMMNLMKSYILDEGDAASPSTPVAKEETKEDRDDIGDAFKSPRPSAEHKPEPKGELKKFAFESLEVICAEQIELISTNRLYSIIWMKHMARVHLSRSML